MKRLLLASVTLLALTGMDVAVAGDLPPGVIYPAGASPSVIYPAAAPAGVVYPAASPTFTFTGFYAGGTVGRLWSTRWWVRQRGTVNSSLTLRPNARGCANLR
jgi:hypothetical protein